MLELIAPLQVHNPNSPGPSRLHGRSTEAGWSKPDIAAWPGYECNRLISPTEAQISLRAKVIRFRSRGGHETSDCRREQLTHNVRDLVQDPGSATFLNGVWGTRLRSTQVFTQNQIQRRLNV